MFKHIWTVCRQTADELFEFVWPLCEVGTWSVKYIYIQLSSSNKMTDDEMFWKNPGDALFQLCQIKSLDLCTLYPPGIYLLKVNNRNSSWRYEICSNLTIKTPERRHWRRSGVFIVNFEHISQTLF